MHLKKAIIDLGKTEAIRSGLTLVCPVEFTPFDRINEFGKKYALRLRLVKEERINSEGCTFVNTVK